MIDMSSTTYIRADCENCKESIEYPSELCGQIAACPHCSQPTRLPIPFIPSPPPISNPPPQLPPPPRINPDYQEIRPGDFICPNPNCGFCGKPKQRPRGSMLVGFILCFLFLIPGVLYFIFMTGYRYYCPKCGIQIANDN